MHHRALVGKGDSTMETRHILKALSPWAEPEESGMNGLSPRLDTLEGKRIGMFATFKAVSVSILDELSKALKAQYPSAEFVYLQSIYETCEIRNKPELLEEVERWLAGVDAVVTAYGDFGSCSLYMGYDAAFFEKRGIPTVMLARPDLVGAAQRGGRARAVAGIRCVPCTIGVAGFPMMTPEIVAEQITPYVEPLTELVAQALTEPLTEQERMPAPPEDHWARDAVCGTAEEIRLQFYKNGWTDGMPIGIPTEEAVAEMLRGTDLPRDHVVALLPPMNGKATVEKIAVNAVMAGCLPTHMPVLIAAVKGMVDPCIALEGWTCSMSSWGPVILVSGPAAKQLDINEGSNYLSPYRLANVAIAKAFSYIIMNISGCRPGFEDLSEMGHENRFGLCLADNASSNPWPPLHTDHGFSQDDSVVSLFWPQDHVSLAGRDVRSLLNSMVKLHCDGWDPGVLFVLSPKAAKLMADGGWTRERIRKYVVEYNRKPGAQVPVSWLVTNNHMPTTVDIPYGDDHPTRTFWSDEHMEIVVGGSDFGVRCIAFTGGGDHGGPSRTRIELPDNWDALVEEYRIAPSYIPY